MSAPPSLRIGIPVYNGERFLPETLRSIEEQTFGDFELVIADNASHDGTEEICRDFADRDARVRYVRHETNLGATANHNYLFETATTEFVKWSASDDLMAPTYVERCMAAVRADPELVMAYARVTRIDESSSVIEPERWKLRLGSPHPHVRFGDVISKHHSCFAVFGVIRTEVVRATPVLRNHVGADRTLLAELALRGRFHEVDEHLLFRRMHPGSYSSGVRLTRGEHRAWWAGPSPPADTADATESGARAASAAEPTMSEIYLDVIRSSLVSAPDARRCVRAVEVRYRLARGRNRVVSRTVWPLKRRLRALVRPAFLRFRPTPNHWRAEPS